MGGNMARRLKDSGHTITAVYDKSPAAANELAQELGAKSCASLAEVTAAAELIFTVVSNDAAQLAVLSAPLRTAASTTTVPRAMAAISRLRARNRMRVGAQPGAASETTRPTSAM